MHIQDRKHAVIIGAGFGGLEAAKALSNEEIDVTLIDRHNYHLFQPLLYQVATSALASAEIAAPIRHILRKCKNITVFMDSVEGIDAKANKVTTKANGQISYDYLVLATGARHSYFGKDEWEDIAPGLKTIDDAFKLRHRILSAFEKAEMEKDEEKKHAYLNFVIVGAGPTGCELAGAIAELARHSLTDDFRNITPKCAKIKLVEGGPRVLAAFDEKLALKAQKNLEKMGVEVITNTIVGDIKPGEVKMGDDILKAETIIWAAGVQASPAGQWLDAETDRSGRVIVGENLSVPGHSNISLSVIQRLIHCRVMNVLCRALRPLPSKWENLLESIF